MCLGKILVVKKLVFALALVCTLSLAYGSQDAWALSGLCSTGGDNDVLLRDTEIYIGDSLGRLHKIEQSDASSCQVGLMSYTVGMNSFTAKCTDLALDAPNQILYCIDDNPGGPNQSQCFSVNRLTAAATVIGSTTLGGANVNGLNAFEMGPFGGAWVASDQGKLYNIDVSNCNLSNQKSLFTGVSNPVKSSGDLIFDVVSNNDLFLTAFQCDNCALNCIDPALNPVVCNGLYKWNIPTMTLSFVADTGFLNVFAGDFVKNTNNICFLTENKELFMLDRITGTQDGVTQTTTVAAFGGTALVFTAGAEILIDQTALLLAAMQSSTDWIIPVVFAGLGLVAFVLARKF